MRVLLSVGAIALSISLAAAALPAYPPECVNWQFRILRDPLPNSVSFPNGSVYVHLGLLARIENDDELAGVVAHHVHHVIAGSTGSWIPKAPLSGRVSVRCEVTLVDPKSGEVLAVFRFNRSLLRPDSPEDRLDKPVREALRDAPFPIPAPKD